MEQNVANTKLTDKTIYNDLVLCEVELAEMLTLKWISFEIEVRLLSLMVGLVEMLTLMNFIWNCNSLKSKTVRFNGWFTGGGISSN